LSVTLNSNQVITASFTQRARLLGEGGPELLSQEGFRLTLTGEFGAVYQIVGSTDLSGWTPLGTVQFTDGTGTNRPQRFYRALALL
jgi:hypothetical protein